MLYVIDHYVYCSLSVYIKYDIIPTENIHGSFCTDLLKRTCFCS